MAVAFDTLEYAQRLRRAGFTPEQAEGQAQALAAVMTESIATKQDLRELEARLTASMDARFAAMDGRLDTMDGRLNTMDGRLDAMDGRLDAMDGRLDAMDGRLDAMDGRLNAMDGHLNAMDGRLGEMGTGLVAMEMRLTLRLGGLMVAGVGVVSALVKLL